MEKIIRQVVPLEPGPHTNSTMLSDPPSSSTGESSTSETSTSSTSMVPTTLTGSFLSESSTSEVSTESSESSESPSSTETTSSSVMSSSSEESTSSTTSSLLTTSSIVFSTSSRPESLSSEYTSSSIASSSSEESSEPTPTSTPTPTSSSTEPSTTPPVTWSSSGSVTFSNGVPVTISQTVDMIITKTNPDGSLVTVKPETNGSGNNDGGGTSTGTIVGSVVGSVAGVAILAVLALMLITRHKKKSLIEVLTGNAKSSSDLGADGTAAGGGPDNQPFSEYHGPADSYSNYRGWSNEGESGGIGTATTLVDRGEGVSRSGSGSSRSASGGSRSVSAGSGSGVYSTGSPIGPSDYSYYRQRRSPEAAAPDVSSNPDVSSTPEVSETSQADSRPNLGRFKEQEDSPNPNTEFDFVDSPPLTEPSYPPTENPRNLPFNSLMHQYERVHGLNPEDEVPMEGLPIPLGYYETVMEEDETPHPVYAQPKAAPSCESRFTETGSL